MSLTASSQNYVQSIRSSILEFSRWLRRSNSFCFSVERTWPRSPWLQHCQKKFWFKGKNKLLWRQPRSVRCKRGGNFLFDIEKSSTSFSQLIWLQTSQKSYLNIFQICALSLILLYSFSSFHLKALLRTCWTENASLTRNQFPSKTICDQIQLRSPVVPKLF